MYLSMVFARLEKIDRPREPLVIPSANLPTSRRLFAVRLAPVIAVAQGKKASATRL
jgi:hypothetical protein